MATPDNPPRHFSMIRGFHLADFFTLGNAACGMAAVFLAMLYMSSESITNFLWAAAMAPAAFVFDVFDGRIARWRQQHSALGRELLSEGGAKPKYFEGTPIPTSVVLTGILAYCAWSGMIDDNLWGGTWKLGPWILHPLALLFGLSGTLMISKTLRIPKL